MTRFLILLTAFCLCFASLSSALANSAANASSISSNHSPSGTWLVAIQARDIGTVRVPMNFTPTGQIGFEAHSRTGALRGLVGFWKSLFARIFGGKAYTRGALIHIMQGTSRRLDDAPHEVVLTGQFLLPLLGSQHFKGTLAQDELTGALSRNDGTITATIVAKRVPANRPVRDYGAVAREIRELMHEKFYNPRELNSPQWRRAFAQLDTRLASAQDDAEALMHFKFAVRSLGISHFALVGENFGEPLPQANSTAKPAAVTLQFPQPHIAQLTLRHFDDGPERIDAAFAALANSDATSLIIDLRANPGGNLSSMAVAAHLIKAPHSAGVFVGARWWQQHSARPSAAQIANLESLDGYSQDAFLKALQKYGAFRGQVLPRTPHFSGTVFVLVDQRTASAAEPLAELLFTSGRATLVGEKTAGLMLSSETLRLPSGLNLILPTADYFTASGKRLEGSGVAPHIEVKSIDAMTTALQLIADHN